MLCPDTADVLRREIIRLLPLLKEGQETMFWMIVPMANGQVDGILNKDLDNCIRLLYATMRKNSSKPVVQDLQWNNVDINNV